MKEALHYSSENGTVVCRLCPHGCTLPPAGEGKCRVRKNVDGVLLSANYGVVSSLHLDPVEKKPLYHFYPGSHILSIGTLGCNFQCVFCQNWSISQESPLDSPGPGKFLKMSPQEVVELALKGRESGNIGIAYTYNEPTIWFEFVLETAALAKEKGLLNVLVTNGFIREEPLKQLLPFISAMNIDIKSMKEEFYNRHCGGRLRPVLKAARLASQACLVEITNLIIPTLNDSTAEFEALAEWILNNLGADTPLHFSRYYPQYQAQIPPTGIKTLRDAYEAAIRKLHYVYVGNVREDTWNNTACPSCGRAVITRSGFEITGYHLTPEHKCRDCGREIHLAGGYAG
ncbi:MAG: AmmeMemoRadiSam system radical SAM enzyme [bacterium]